MSHEQYIRTGRIMFFLVWILLFVGLFLFFHYYDKRAIHDISYTSHELILNADRSGHYRVAGTINHNAVEFLIDTGATTVALGESTARRLALQGRYPIIVSTANGKVQGSVTRLEQLTFGGFKLHDVKAVIVPNIDDDSILLGMNVLSRFTIEQKKNRLVLKTH